jgi:3-oxoacyl-(acyl-carrier-protein) synthase
MTNNVAIIGSGIVSAIGCTKSEVLTALLEERSGICEMLFLDSLHHEFPVGEVKMSNSKMKEMLGIEEDRIVSRTVLMGALAIKQAVEEAKPAMPSLPRIVIINGTTVGGMDITERFYNSMKIDKEYLSLINHHDCGSCTSEMASICGINAEICTVSTACSASLNAIAVGADMLRREEADIVIAGGAEALSKFHLNGFNTLMILDKDRCRPFDDSRAGLNLGEGAAFVVMTRSDECANSLTKSLTIEGYGNACDAFHQTATSDEGIGATLAMKEALSMAGLLPAEIDYINAHGTGTPNNDSTESEALMRVFGEHIPPVSSTKPFTGHTTSASGAIELIICQLAMENGFIPTNLGWTTPMKRGIKPSVGTQHQKLHYVMCNSFGFGGNDTSLILGYHIQSKSKKSEYKDVGIEIAASCEIHSAEELDAVKDFITPMEARRMGKLLKAATLTSLTVLKEACVEIPDAIITATSNGMVENSEKFLEEMIENRESLLKPTLFMQSTHNTIGSSVAIRLCCHGYNITYCQGERSLEWGMKDAVRLIQSGRAETVLVGCHDESTSQFNDFRCRMGKQPLPMIYSKSILLKKKKE